MKENHTSCIILAGGKSSRMGKDKGQLILGEELLAEKGVNYLKQYFEEVIFVTNHPEKAPWSESLIVVEDEVPYQGPLGGILAGLQVSSHFYNFVVAYDMPFLNPQLIFYLLSLAREGIDVVVPKLKRGLEPLHGIYSKNCIIPIRKQLKKGDFRIISFFDKVKVKLVEEAELKKVDPSLSAFFNINTWEDYRKAQEIYAKRKESN